MKSRTLASPPSNGPLARVSCARRTCVLAGTTSPTSPCTLMPSTEVEDKSSPLAGVCCTLPSLPLPPPCWSPSSWWRSKPPKPPSAASTVCSTSVVAICSLRRRGPVRPLSTARPTCPSLSPLASLLPSGVPLLAKPSLSASLTIGNWLVVTPMTPTPRSVPSSRPPGLARVSRKPSPLLTTSLIGCRFPTPIHQALFPSSPVC
mmetsp:Transcript_147473/g.209340  ORF Transcript_147473/g.209340 Transcript_147473/m.209340 type:complete len:204 (-) Transcript_147473:27-638(-)